MVRWVVSIEFNEDMILLYSQFTRPKSHAPFFPESLMYALERRLLSGGHRSVAGVDEAGRGPLAGPVVAAAVVLDPEDPIEGLADSKKLTPKRRESLLAEIEGRALSVAVAAVGARAIERINILQASLRAMATAVRRLDPPLDYLLIDGNKKIPIDMPQLAVVSGDSTCACIAAASIVAKVVRDRLMRSEERRVGKECNPECRSRWSPYH
jgi:ribonuclease HII